MDIREDVVHCVTELRFIFEHIEKGDMAPRIAAKQGKKVCRKLLDLTPVISPRGTIDEI